ncbi:MAG: NADH-quinone oxidoreductase subunit D [candidate division Zixibacteria bacterium]|nr:NADH-quinone oxidoreductase subunit D [candidate division Zixibacteria bacterium]MBU1470463.1 NADH-quinone oxidoreductase subunit D [candidate division Zixibacteria bacterium]MBU2625912.1 NADH-quinone oxidoreductase subunit D [candidate division Zixibacteria bacterium]
MDEEIRSDQLISKSTDSGFATEEFMVNMGPQHPSTHGVCRLLLTMDGEVVKDCQPHVGYLHRAIEKISENRTYAQIIPLTDRFEYLTSMACNWVFCLGVERISQMEVPERAEYIRVIMVELNRIASHLVWLGTFGLDLGAITPFLYCLRERELIMDLFEMTCGQRLLYNYIRVGGVSRDLPVGFEKKCKEFVGYFMPLVDDYEALLTNNPIFLTRTKNIGILPVDMALNYAVSGPVLRGSGLKWDLRKDDPYGYYHKFDFEIPTGTVGDTWDRYIVRINEMRQSALIVKQAIEGLPEGEFRAKVKPSFKPPAGECYTRIEAARGEMGAYIVSDGTAKPTRLRLRGSSYNHIMVLPEIVKGLKIADLVAIFASFDAIMPEVDR